MTNAPRSMTARPPWTGCSAAGRRGRPRRDQHPRQLGVPGPSRCCQSSRKEGPEPGVLRCGYPAAQASLPVVEDDVTPAPTAFLSHASEDKADFVEPLGRELADMGIRPWLDKWEIRPGDSLVEKLFDEGVAAVDAVIVVVSQYSAGKPWVRAELDTAVVRRITEGTRLIPVRLDAADMPAPLRMLAWHDADRTEDGIQGAARLIAGTIHGLDPRPAVAPPPTYTSAARIPGLTAGDSALLTLLAEEAIAVGNLLYVPWPAVVARAAGQGLDEGMALESLAVLEQRHYAKRQPIHAGGVVLAVELASGGFRAVADAIVPGAEAARQQIVASLVNTPSDSITIVDDLATLTGTPPCSFCNTCANSRQKDS